MRLKTVCAVYATMAGIICLNFLMVPAFWIRLYGATADPQALLLFRLIGTLFAGLAVIAWAGRAAQTSASERGLRHGLIMSNGLAAGVAVFGALSGVYNQLAWGPVAMFSVLTLAFLFVRPTGAAMHPSQ